MVTLLKKRKVSQNAFDEIGCKSFSVPTRSTALNPTENMLNIVRRQLKEQAVTQKITRETWKLFLQELLNR